MQPTLEDIFKKQKTTQPSLESIFGSKQPTNTNAQQAQQAIAQGKASGIVAPTLGQKLGTRLESAKSQVRDNLANIGNVRAGETRAATPFEAGLGSASVGLTEGFGALGDVIGTGLGKVVGQQNVAKASEAIGNVLRPSLEAVGTGLNKVGDALGVDPTTRRSVGAGINVGSSLVLPRVASPALGELERAGARTVRNTAEAVSEKTIKPGLERIGESSQARGATRLKENVFTKDKATLNNYLDTNNELRKAGTSVDKVIKDRQLPIRATSDGAIDTTAATNALQNEITIKSKGVRNLIDGYTNSGVTVSKQSWIDDMVAGLGKTINNPNIATQLQKARRIIDDYYAIHAPDGNMPLSKVDDLKKALYENSSAYAKQGGVDPSDIGAIEIAARGARASIEKQITDAKISQINREIGSLLESKAFLEKINGNKLRGGRLGTLANKAVASVAGAVAGGSLGAVSAGIGALAAPVVVGQLAKLGFRRQVGQSILSKLKASAVKSPTDAQVSRFLQDLEDGGAMTETLDEAARARLLQMVQDERAVKPPAFSQGAIPKNSVDMYDVGGAAMGGIQTDEEGNITFNPVGAALGSLGMRASRAMRQDPYVFAKRMSPEIQTAFEQFKAMTTLTGGLPSKQAIESVKPAIKALGADTKMSPKEISEFVNANLYFKNSLRNKEAQNFYNKEQADLNERFSPFLR